MPHKKANSKPYLWHPGKTEPLIKLLDKQFTLYKTEAQILEAVEKIATEIANDYKDEVPIFVGVLNGAFMFVADFLKFYPHPCEVSFVKLSSYRGLTSTGIVETLLDVPDNIEGKSVIILEDIIDTGRTLQELVHLFSNTNVKEFKIASLFYKSDVYNGEYSIDYFGIEIPNDFLIGYGLDYKEQGRNLRDVYQLKPNQMINLVLFGKPGAGKGTQAAFLRDKYGLLHISTGDVFRRNIKNSTPLGKLAQSYMDKGELVPDEVTIKMLRDEVETHPEASGFIFDGFPRTAAQAQALDNLMDSKDMEIHATIALDADEDELTERLLSRGKESGRSDDQDEDKIRIRFKEYNDKTAPLVAYYKEQEKFHRVDGVGEISEVTSRIEKIIDSLQLVNK